MNYQPPGTAMVPQHEADYAVNPQTGEVMRPLPPPAAIMQAIDDDAAALTQYEGLLDAATNTLANAEHAWLEHLDTTAGSMEEENEGSRPPSEHRIMSEARRTRRDLWRAYRNAELDVKRLKSKISARGNAMSGRQSELNAMKGGVA